MSPRKKRERNKKKKERNKGESPFPKSRDAACTLKATAEMPQLERPHFRSFPIFADDSHRGADQEEQGAEAGRAGKEILQIIVLLNIYIFVFYYFTGRGGSKEED